MFSWLEPKSLKRMRVEYKKDLEEIQEGYKKKSGAMRLEFLMKLKALEWQLESANEKLMHARVSQRTAEENLRFVNQQLILAFRKIDGQS